MSERIVLGVWPRLFPASVLWVARQPLADIDQDFIDVVQKVPLLADESVVRDVGAQDVSRLLALLACIPTAVAVAPVDATVRRHILRQHTTEATDKA